MTGAPGVFAGTPRAREHASGPTLRAALRTFAADLRGAGCRLQAPPETRRRARPSWETNRTSFVAFARDRGKQVGRILQAEAEALVPVGAPIRLPYSGLRGNRPARNRLDRARPLGCRLPDGAPVRLGVRGGFGHRRPLDFGPLLFWRRRGGLLGCRGDGSELHLIGNPHVGRGSKPTDSVVRPSIQDRVMFPRFLPAERQRRPILRATPGKGNAIGAGLGFKAARAALRARPAGGRGRCAASDAAR